MTHAPSARLLLATALGGAALLATTLTPTGASAEPERRADVQRLHATLSPSGDSDGSGTAHFKLNKARHKVCADVTWQNIADPDSAHIHKASTGAIVVDLSGAVTGGSHCATKVSGTLIGKILGHPGRYYFNVHNPEHSAGAIQGKLKR